MSVIVRNARPDDLAAIGVLAGKLVKLHYDFDPLRFLLVDNVEAGYAHFFASQLSSSATIILAAELDGEIVGYAYARLEPRDWNALLDAHGALHDIYVIDSVRRQGVARLLVDAVRDRLRARGARRLVLHTASKNVSAQHFFESLGLRHTMIELTEEL
jgi:ribosomal protein S18 acetylase RimI-like enzyme